jgi:predicted amino acid-binding ACT domain protein
LNRILVSSQAMKTKLPKLSISNLIISHSLIFQLLKEISQTKKKFHNLVAECVRKIKEMNLWVRRTKQEDKFYFNSSQHNIKQLCAN